MKKFLTAFLIGAFVFGVGSSNFNFVSANSQNDKNFTQNDKQKNPPQMKNGENPPEPPKDSNGKPLPPPDKKNVNSDDKKNSPDSQKDSSDKKFQVQK